MKFTPLLAAMIANAAKRMYSRGSIGTSPTNGHRDAVIAYVVWIWYAADERDQRGQSSFWRTLMPSPVVRVEVVVEGAQARRRAGPRAARRSAASGGARKKKMPGDDDDDQQAAHRRRAFLDEVASRALLADALAEPERRSSG